MNDFIVCPNCKTQIPLTEAITHQIDEKYRVMLESEKKRNEEERQKFIVLAQKRIEEEKVKAVQEKEAELKTKIGRELELKLKNSQNESTELKDQNKMLQEQLLELNKLMRQLRNENEQKALELEKKLAAEQEKIRQEEQKRLEEQFRLRVMEKEKQLHDAIKVNEDLRRKLEQGSQQMQGEILEIAIEEALKKEFPFDEIQPVPKGITGADIVQVVKNSSGKVCGTIIWETKRTKAWSNEWVTKVKDDQRNLRAELSVIVTQVLPPTLQRFGFLDGVWICEYELITGIAFALRNQLVEIATLKSSMVGKSEKMELLYSYLSGVEFKQRVEAIIDAFTAFQTDIEKEKRWFAAKWSKQEKSIRKVIDNTLGMHGDLQSIMGKALSELKGLEMLPEKTIEESATDQSLF